MGTVLLPNRNLATQIREWREGLDIIKAETQEFQATRWGRFRALAPQLVKIKILFETSQWEFSLPRRIRKDSLMTLGFRCLRGETSAFTLMHNGELVEGEWTPSVNTYTISLKAGMAIVICKSLRTASAAQTPTMALTKPAAKQRERVLVKVYNRNTTDRDNSPAFTFWILRNTQSTIASVLFRYWTLTTGRQTGAAAAPPHAFKVWARNTYGGDGTYFGHPQDSWEPLANLLSHYTTDGSTAEKDPLYEKDGVDEVTLSRGNQNIEAKEAKVLKLLLHREGARKGSKRKSKHTDRILTRVGFLRCVCLVMFTVADMISHEVDGCCQTSL